MKGFCSINPYATLIYFLSILLITMFISNPVIQAISLIGSLLLLWELSDVKSFFSDLLFYTLIFLLITITNPLFSHNGETTLFFLIGNPITLEALLYGMQTGTMMISVICWCKALSRIFTADKIMCVLGKTTPKLALIISMTLRFIPLLKRQFKKIINAQKMLGVYSQESKTDRLKATASNMSVLTGWSMENALDTANAMKSRGYGLKPRSEYSLFNRTVSDLLFSITVITLTTIIIISSANNELRFNFFPILSEIKSSALSITAYLSFAILSSMPFLIETEEKIKWKFYISKI